MCLEGQKRRHKMYGTYRDKKVCLKKEIKELEMTEHTCFRKYVRSTKGSFHPGK